MLANKFIQPIRGTHAEEKELEHDHCLRRRTDCPRCEILSKQCNILKQKLISVTNEFESLKENQSQLQMYDYLPQTSPQRRENTGPITVLLCIANDENITDEIYDILEQHLPLVTQCQMLLIKNEYICDITLNSIPNLQSQHISAIKSVINNYYQITESTQSIMNCESKQDKFIFYLVWYSISICDRITCVITKEYWICLDYLTVFMYDQISNFEAYVSRFIPLKLSGSIIEDVCREYNHIKPFTDELRTLKDVISSWANKTMDNNESPISQLSQVTQVELLPIEVDEITPESNDESMIGDLEELHLSLSTNAKEAWNVNAKDFVPNTCSSPETIIPPKTMLLASISEDLETPKVVQIRPEREILTHSTDNNAELKSNNTESQPQITGTVASVTETKNAETETKTEYKQSLSSAPQYTFKCESKQNNRCDNKFFIAPELISKINKKCVERFDTFKNNDEGLLFDYIKQSISVQFYDKQIKNEFRTGKGVIAVLNIDLHFKDYQTMYLIAIENDSAFRHKMKWRVVNFMRSYQILTDYGLNSHKLPDSSRTKAQFSFGINTPPKNVPISTLTNANLKTLKGKFSKRKNQSAQRNVLRISEQDLRYYCQQSWYNNDVMIPVVVIKGKKVWVEWKRFIYIGKDNYGQPQWIGISLRYYRSNKQWKIECIEYDSGRIYYQHRLIGNCNINNRYIYSYKQLIQYNTPALEIY